jgi:hypothetical protein
MNARVLMETLKNLGIHSCDTVGCLAESFAFGIFTYRHEDFANRAADPLEVHLGCRSAGRDLIPLIIATTGRHREFSVAETGGRS